VSDLLYGGWPRKEKSESSAIADASVAEFCRARPGAVVDVLDLWPEGLPAFDGDRAAAKMTVFSGQQLEGVEASAWEAVTAAFERFSSADSYLFTVPMWKGGIPTATPDEARQAAHRRARDLANSTRASRVA
jgi:FMN-dependent NADH-azoreductase